MRRFVLGADVGQCCGGVVQVWMERYGTADLGWLRAAQAAAERGTAMLVTRFSQGALERRVITHAQPPVISLIRHSSDDFEIREALVVRYPPLWLYGAGHVGQALVRTPDNFGSLASPPTNPELLDSQAKQVAAYLMSLRKQP